MSTLLLLSLLPALAGQTRVPAMVNGIETDEPEAVVALVIEDDGEFYGPFCSGTLIHPNWVLTAAHCVTAIQGHYAGFGIYALTGGDLLHDGYQRDALVVSSIADPAYDDTRYTDDIGLLELSGAGLSGVDPIPLNQEVVGSGWVGDDLRFVGFGITDDGAEDMGVKRYADIPLLQYDAELLYAYDPEDGQNVCQGDSGGACLEPQGGGGWELAGVTAFVGLFKGHEGEDPCADGFVGATRVDTHLDWILANTGGDLELDTGDGDGSLWGGKGGGLCAAVPAGRGLAGLLLALGMTLLRRRI